MFNLSTIQADDLQIGPTADDVVVAAQPEPEVNNILHDKKGTFGSLERIPEIKAKVEAEKPKEVIEQAPVVNTGLNLEKLAEKMEPQAEPGAIPAKTDRNPITGYLQSKIELGEFFTWNDYDEKKQSLPDYLGKLPEKELYDLLDKNIEKQKNLGYEEAPGQLREALPSKAKYIIDQLEQGGDLESILTHITRAVQVEKLDPTNEAHMPEIARNYLQLKNFGTPEMINAQVQDWADEGKLESKVKEFKPLLDQMHEQQIQYQVQQEATINKQRQEAAEAFTQNVGTVLSKYQIGDIKLSKKDASELYYDLTEANYQSQSGRPTNIIGHVLEKIQVVEPDFQKLTRLALFMKDMDAYDERIRNTAKSEKAQEIVRELKDAQYIRTQVAPQQEPAEREVKKQFKPRNVFSKETT